LTFVAERRTLAPLNFVLSRTLGRFFLVLGVLAAVAAWRLDGAVGTAYRTGWVAQKFAGEQQTAVFGCSHCWRLPSASWLWADAWAGALALVFLALSAYLFYRRQRPEPFPDPTVKDTALSNRAGAKRMQSRVHRFVLGAFFGVLVLALAAFVTRQLAARGYGTSVLRADSLIQLAALALVGVMVIAAAASSPATETGPYTFIWRVLRFLYRQRVNVLVLALLALVLLFVGQTSGQAVDSIRTWGFDTWHARARIGFGLGAVLLLSLVVYETAVQLTQVSMRDRRTRTLSRWFWPILGLALIVAGAVFKWAFPVGFGLISLGVLALLLGLLDLPRLEGRVHAGLSGDELERQTRYDENVAEMLAIVPLLLFAATAVSAAIDAALVGGKRNGLMPLWAALILAALAVLMTVEGRPSRFDLPGIVASAIVGVVVTGGAVLLVFFDSERFAAFVGAVTFLVGVGYAVVVFRRRPTSVGSWTPDLCCKALSLPVIGAVGVGVFLAVHGNPYTTANTLGTLAVVCIGFAFWLAALNVLIVAAYDVRAPRALAWIGIERLPVVTIVVVAWIAAGAIAPPPTLHQARLTDRQPIDVGGVRVIPAAPTLPAAFDSWVAAQPELAAGGPGGRPVPMLLVAAHGGGIRAAYWTALALDCIIGVSANRFDETAVLAGNDEARAATCASARRSPKQQQAAARRIFLASGVSGGAFGLYAYARQLIAAQWLGERADQWVDDRLARDFASATIAWGLFHDAPTHWFGLNSHRDGTCQWHWVTCLTMDRAAVLEETFDRAWHNVGTPAFPARLRLAWDMRSSTDPPEQHVAETIPLLVMNTTVTGGKARGVVDTANLGSWPTPETRNLSGATFDKYPLAGTVEVVEAMCATKDTRLSTAALLAGRFPYVSPAGHISGHCRRSRGDALEADRSSVCARAKAAVCEMRLVDGGYAENSGLFTIDALWPSIRQLVVRFNRSKDHPRKIAPVIVELDNHYQAALEAQLGARGSAAETLVPLATAFGARNAQETFARALAYRLRPPGCTVTISPGLHPGLTAPLGWELSDSARDDLKDGLTRPHPTAVGDQRYFPVLELRRLQQWLGGGQTPVVKPKLGTCVPGNKAN
jgi:hypothetical protein